MRRRALGALAAVGAALLLFAPAAVRAQGGPSAGWRKIALPATGSYLWRYVPESLDRTKPAPVVLFFHGAGGKPEGYKPFVLAAAEAAGCVAVLPKSFANTGWGGAEDDSTVAESLRLVRAELPVDERRIAGAGHSSGGAYAYLTAYTAVPKWSAVFSLAAPSRPIAAVADPAYKAPIRMYYGTTDPNYTGGSYAALKAQWIRLGVPWQEEIAAGYGHSTWPETTLADGFRFLVAQRYPEAAEPACVASATTLCLRGGRFRVEVAWRDPFGHTGPGTVVPGAVAEESGLFWFFTESNWEMLVKVLDGCAATGHYWVYAAATTTVEYDLTVTDTRTGARASYHNVQGTASPAITDARALRTCP